MDTMSLYTTPIGGISITSLSRMHLNEPGKGFRTGIPMAIELRPIGYVRSLYQKPGDAPRQGRLSDTISEIVIDQAYRDALLDIGEKKYLFVLCWFDRADRTTLRAVPPQDTAEHGVFAIRSPDRPNPISICVVDLLGVKDGVLRVRGLDAFDGTPVIDIKPYFADLDCPAPE